VQQTQCDSPVVELLAPHGEYGGMISGIIIRQLRILLKIAVLPSVKWGESFQNQDVH